MQEPQNTPNEHKLKKRKKKKTKKLMKQMQLHIYHKSHLPSPQQAKIRQ